MIEQTIFNELKIAKLRDGDVYNIYPYKIPEERINLVQNAITYNLIATNIQNDIDCCVLTYQLTCFSRSYNGARLLYRDLVDKMQGFRHNDIKYTWIDNVIILYDKDSKLYYF